MDEIDRATDRVDEMFSDALLAVRLKMPRGESAKDCVKCGEHIPQARRSAVPGVQTCITCKQRAEWSDIPCE